MSILALTSNTLAGSPGAGQIEYNGQFYATDSNSSRGQLERLVQSTAQASTSGTSITFTGIPAWAKRITVMFNGVSTSGTSNILIQIGSGSVTTTGYASGAGAVSNLTANTTIGVQSTAGFIIYASNAADVLYGSSVISNVTSNSWVSFTNINTNTGQSVSITGAGGIALSGALDRVVITTVNGTDTFDAGSINIMYEG